MCRVLVSHQPFLTSLCIGGSQPRFCFGLFSVQERVFSFQRMEAEMVSTRPTFGFFFFPLKVTRFKLNPDLDVISWHVDPHILNSLGTIPLSEVGKIEVVEEGMSPYDHVFMIQTIMGRQYYLAAESKTILQYWVDGINNALADLARDKADRSSAHLTLGTSSKPSPPPSSSSTSSSS